MITYPGKENIDVVSAFSEVLNNLNRMSWMEWKIWVQQVLLWYMQQYSKIKTLLTHPHSLGKRVLYYDTDSCVYVRDERVKNTYKPKLSNRVTLKVR